MKNRRIKIGIKIAIVLLIVVLGVGLVAGNCLYSFALSRNSSIAFVPTEEQTGTNGNTSGIASPWMEPTEWLVSNSVIETLNSRDGLELKAYNVKNNSRDRYVVICHGYRSEALQMDYFAKKFYEIGFSVLVPDARGCGKSEGEYIGMGWPEREDIVDWCKLIIKENPDAEIVLYGVSMGGATVMMASGELDLPSNVKCVIEDCGYTSIWDQFAVQVKDIFGLPTFPLLNIMDTVTKLRAGFSIKEGSAIDQIAKSNIPTLFIHGEEDTFVPFYMLSEVYEAAECEKEKIEVPGAGHGEAVSVNPEIYWDKVEEFIKRYINIK